MGEEERLRHVWWTELLHPLLLEGSGLGDGGPVPGPEAEERVGQVTVAGLSSQQGCIHSIRVHSHK